ncbi:MAG: Ig-like domain repeat protein [Chloroflexi bacterium]|nr:Ig-like domain repeat protein [Chloroflexota bacterium]
MQNKRSPKFDLFEPTKVFFVLWIVAILWIAPVAFPQWETKPGEPEVKSLTVLSVVSANPPDVCSDECKVWYCAEKIPGGGCLEWTFHCAGCDGGGGGGGPVYQPPTISHVLNCSNIGSNGWCIGSLSLDLTASDPQGQSVVISGDINGITFACTSGQTTCSIPLSEGTGTANYKVDSATGLSASGTTTYQLDVTTPQVDGNINGSSGTSGWYISQTSVTASASDALSGLATFEVNADNAGWSNYTDTTFTDGAHTIQFRATDNAGNVTETAAQSINVDTVAPTLNLSTTGTTGNNGWYVSAVTLTPTANDATSGLAALEVTTDGVTWSSVSGAITLNDGIYTVQFRATDQAGNISETTAQQIKVDATTPSLSLNINGTRGQNDWYISSVTVTPNASDAGSGINKVEASVHSGAWETVSSPLSFSDGTHTYSIRVTDNAGNVTETSVLPMMVDTVPPAIAISDDQLKLGDILNYDLEDSLSGLWINRSVIEDEDEKYKKIVWLEELTGKKSNDNEIRWDGVFADGTHAAPGQYYITLKISDQAGNETMQTVVVEVNAFNSLLPIPAFTPPASMVTEPVPSGSSTTNEQSFGGANNGNVGTETTTTNGETVFASVNLQAGGTSSFTAGNQMTSSPIANPNILWGAAAAAVLGATLADWQKKREEEAARLAALRNSGGGGGDEDEGSSKRKSPGRIAYEKKMQQKHIIGALQAAAKTSQAKPVNQLAKIDTEEERLEAYKQTAGYQARQESYAEYYAKKEQEKQNAVSAARWAGAASVAQAKQDSEKENTGGKALAMPIRDDDPPEKGSNWWDKVKQAWEDVKVWTNDHIVQPVKDTFTKTVTTVKDFVINTAIAIQNKYEETKKATIQKWEDTKAWVNDHVVQPIKNKWNESVQTFTNTLNMIYPERVWNEFSPSERAQLLNDLRNEGDLGKATADYIVQEEIRLGYLAQPKSGAGWTFLGNISFPPNMKLKEPRTLSLVEHEVLHISTQSIFTKLSVYGELQAWQLEYWAYHESTGKYYGQTKSPFGLDTYDKWKELSQLSVTSRDDLERAQILMREISPSYRSNVLPLEPVHKEILYFLSKGEIDKAFGVIPTLLSGR